MNTDQLIENLGKAAAAAQPPSEYCFMWIDWWGTCMTKEEWSGWAQFLAVAFTLLAPYAITYRKKKQAKKLMITLIEDINFNLGFLKAIARDAASADKEDAEHVLTDIEMRFKYLREPIYLQLDALNMLSPATAVQLLTAIAIIKSRAELIKGLRTREDIFKNKHLYLHLGDQSDRLLADMDGLNKVLAWAKSFS
jgi:hypothetical protein